MKLILATNNAHKVREIREILGGRFEEIITLREAGIVHETVEDGETFMENARKKAREITELSGLPALADDSGLCVRALGGAPGVHSARYASLDGHDASDEDNRKKLFQALEGVTDRTAWFTSAVCLTFPDGREVSAEGHVYGEITHEEKGENGFGYDCMFYVPDKGMTTAEMSAEAKNAISHRGQALRELEKKL